jgi:hypothetical protein
MTAGGMRRRRQRKPANQTEQGGRSSDKLKRHHPLRMEYGDSRIMPHELPEVEFIEWKILNGMSDEGYKESVRLGDDFLEDIKDNGIPLPTDKLSSDQRGWAKVEYPEHFNNEIARWKPVKGKSSKVEPYKVKLVTRDRQYNEHCSCGEADMEFWGTRWDNVPLYQCQNCGEVVLRKEVPVLVTAGDNDDNINEENDSNDDT